MMPQENNQYENISEEIQQIIGQVPNWITRWGISMLFALLIVLIIVGNFINYPNIIHAKAEIISVKRPTRIDWFNEETLAYQEIVKDGQKVNVGDSILIENNLKTGNQSVITSPLSGEISLTRGYKNDANTHVIWIIPRADQYTVLLKVPIRKSGKVKIGQLVQVYLDEYPENEFGFLSGKVERIMPIAMEEHYRVYVQLDSRLVTNTKKRLPDRPNFFGNAEIISDNVNILKRIFGNMLS